MSDNSVEVKITGDASGAEQAMQKGSSAVKAGAESIKGSTEQINSAGATMAQKLAEAFAKVTQSAQAATEQTNHHLKEMAEQAKEHGEAVEGSLKKMSGAMKLFGEIMIAGVIGEQLAEMAERTGEFGEQLEHASAKTGLSSEALQQFQFAAKMSGVSAQELTQSLVKLSKNMSTVNGDTSPMAEAFAKVGLSAKELDGMKLDEVLGKIANKFSESEDGANKTAVAVELFGRAGAQMIPLLNKGSEGLEEMKAKALELGIVIDESGVKKAAALGEQMKELSAVNESAAVQIGLTLTPAFLGIAKAFEKNLQEGGAFKDFLEGISKVMVFVAEMASHVAQGFQEMGNIIAAFAAEITFMVQGNLTAANAVSLEFDKKMQSMAASYDKFRADLHKPAEIATPEEEGGKKKDIGALGSGAKAPKSKMKEFETQLAEQKAAIAKEEDADGNHRQITLSEEAEFWAARLALTQKGSEDRLSVADKIANIEVQQSKQNFEKLVESLKAQEAEQKNHGDVIIELARKEAAAIGAFYGTNSQQYEAAQKHITEVTIAESLKQSEAQIIAISRVSKLQSTEIDTQIDAIKEAAKKGELSKNQEIAQEAVFLQQKLKLQQDALNQEIQIYSANPNHDPSKLASMYDALEQVTATGERNILKVQQQSVSAQEMLYSELKTSMDNLISKGFDSMLNHTLTWSNATRGILQGLGQAFKNFAVKQAEDWFQTEVLKTAYTQAQTAIRGVLVSVGVIKDTAATKTGAGAQISANAGIAGSGAAAAVAPTPFIGPALAVAAMSETIAAVLGTAGAISASPGFAAGSWSVPSDGIAKIHQGETIIPAQFAEMYRNGGQKGGGDVHMHVQAIDAHSVKKLFNDHGATLASVLKRQAGKFNL